jgi:hypothetical protein
MLLGCSCCAYGPSAVDWGGWGYGHGARPTVPQNVALERRALIRVVGQQNRRFPTSALVRATLPEAAELGEDVGLEALNRGVEFGEGRLVQRSVRPQRE